jgi:hypothetical protein
MLSDLLFQVSDQPHIFTCSFSDSRDQLSQWRAYTAKGGYAISFNADALNSIGLEQGYLFARCIYNDTEKLEIAREFLQAGLARADTEDPATLSVLLVNDFLVIAAMMKHAGFAEENEWRLISTTSRLDKEKYKFRSTARYLVPYLEVSLEINPGKTSDGRNYLGFDEVLIAPAPEPELSWRSCMQLLIDRNIYFEQITPSGTPYRSNL